MAVYRGFHCKTVKALRDFGAGASVIAIAALWSGAAMGQCTPDPSISGQAVSCGGTTTNTYTIATDNSPLTVAAGAAVATGSGQGIVVSIPSTGYYDYRQASITINGSVSAASGSGIQVLSGSPAPGTYDFGSTSATITVAQGASVSGVTGIYVGQTAGPYSAYAQADAAIDNAGTITGTGGVAISGDNTGSVGVTITNEATGVIGAINAPLQGLTNAGTINGGSLSAIAPQSTTYYSSVTNSGTITSAAATATIVSANSYGLSLVNSGTITNSGGGAAFANANSVNNEVGGTITSSGATVISGTSLSVTNSGTIANTGSGTALSGTTLSLSNGAGAVISGGPGAAAIAASGFVYLSNQGTINGDVTAGSSGIIDSSLGTINGNVTFGVSGDTIVATPVNGVLQTGITGTITAPVGTNTLQVNTIADATMSNAVTLPANFTQFALSPAAGTTLTLAQGFVTSSTIDLIGNGAVINATTLSGPGTVIYEEYGAGPFTNTGTITSANAQGAATITGQGYAGLTNSGTITATGAGAAISGIYGITNQAGGTISGNGDAVLAGPGVYVMNSGTLTNTGSGAVVSDSATVNNAVGGTISASGATVINGTQLNVTNAGTIINTGSGTAISGANLTLNNTAGGVVSGGSGGAAIVLSGTLSLSNQGTINGDVSASGIGTVDSTQGTINGNLAFGTSGDTLVANLVNGALQTGITGTITAPVGANTLQINTAADATLSGGLTLPANFNQFALSPAGGTTLTLASGFATSAPIAFIGSGTLVNATTLSGAGTVLNGGFFAGNFVNTGTVTSTTAPGAAAIVLTGYSTLTNSGAINSAGNGVLMQGYGLINSGTITAVGTAVDVDNGSNTPFANSGTIMSLGGTAVVLGQSCTCDTSTNSGTINGAQLGVLLQDGVLANSGTITSGGTGVSLSDYGTLINMAGATISGNQAIANPYGSATVVNAGQIEGNVNLAAGSLYDAVTGGSLGGNLVLGANATLIVDYSSAGGLSGITGTVSANQGNLIYNVGSNAAVTLGGALPAGFATVGYQLSNNAALALTTTGTLGTTVSLTGTGSVTFSGSVATAGMPALATSYTLVPQTGSLVASALAVTTTGSLSATNTNPYSYVVGAVQLGSGDTLNNSGVITLTDTTGSYNIGAAVSGGQTITNSGQITGIGANGIALGDLYPPSATTVSLINSGTISSNINAIIISKQVTIVNSGTISSSAMAAIGSSIYYNSATVINAGGGVISGANDAIDLASGTISNAGTINGNVNLGVTAGDYPGYGTGSYIANGGTLNGNLAFGNQEAILIETGSGFGVAGTISTAGTPDESFVGHLRTTDGTVVLGSTLPAGFGQEFVLASGASTTITVTGPATSTSDILVGGNGSIVNRANTSGTLAMFNLNGLSIPDYTGGPLASLTNEAAVGSIAATSVKLVNAGTVAGQAAQSFTGSGEVTNSGTIGGGLVGIDVIPAVLPPTVATYAITNSGTITGAVGTQPGPAVVVFASQDQYFSGPAGQALGLSLTNSGTITGDILLPDSGTTIVDSATGTITGDIVLASGASLTSGVANSVSIAGGFAGSIDGGSGASTSLTVSGGSATAPVAFANLANIASYSQTGGYATISGNAALGGVTITGGDLVGLLGSAITTPTLSIGAQGTFQSGGTVNGNIVSAGLLHVGASPDTLKVNGNVALNAGSTTLFEVSNSTSSKLVVSGKVAIAAGATLQIKALQTIMPGTSLDLIAAAGGISGTFSQVNGLYGKLLMVDGDLTFLTLFDPGYAPNAQVAGSIGYVNSALTSGKASSALMAALPALTASDGAPISDAFARLTPEPYASAIQIGVENGLILSRAARDVSANHTMVSGHLFSFGQALGNWRGMHGDSEGASAANISGFGFLGGLGIQAGPVSLAAFGGYLDQTQSIAALGARTRATGFVGGVTAGLDAGLASATVSVLRDQSNAATTRSLPGSGSASADYALHGWTVDGQIGLRLPLGSGWQAKPHVGATWVWTDRGTAAETGNSVFDLDVDGMHHTAGFADGGLRIESDPAAQRRLTSFVDLGVRWQMQGRLVTAQASFDNLPTDFVAQGVRRSPFSALVSSGVSYRLTPAVNVLVSASGELTQTGGSANVTGGVRVNF